MCRMLATVGPYDRAALLVSRFHREAVEGDKLADHPRGHRDGWGIVKPVRGSGGHGHPEESSRSGGHGHPEESSRSGGHGHPEEVQYLGRSPRDAFDDPEYAAAAERVRGPGRGTTLVHLRAASMGAVNLENTHPFLKGGLAFAHNGSVNDIAAPGANDSRAYFQQILDERQAPEAALRAVARRLSKERSFSSLTCLMTDGRSLWGVRKVGDPEEGCTKDACAAYYALAVATHGDITVVSQETHVIPGADWHAVPDGHLLAVRPDGAWETTPL